MKRKFHDETSSEREVSYTSVVPSSSPSLSAHTSSSRSCKYDVFLNFRGIDVRKNFVDHLYKALEDRGIHTYKDDQTLPSGESIGPSLYRAIEESQIAITVFSEHYASSAWCLEELAYIIKLREEKRLILLPIFYNVTPSEMRSLTGSFGCEFTKQINKNKNKSRAELWRKALDEASQISGWEPTKMAGGFESRAINVIADKVLVRLFPNIISGVNEHLVGRVGPLQEWDEEFVGMRERLQELEAMLDIDSGGVRMIGIWGLGGIGKTTLAICLRKKIAKHFFGHCLVKDVRAKTGEKGLEKLQEVILSVFFQNIFQQKEHIQSVDDGRDLLRQMLHNKKVLLVLDDVSDGAQLEALAGKHDWFGDGSRILITTRNKDLLHKIDETYPVRLLSNDHAFKLFRMHAYDEKHPIEDYSALSAHVVSYAARLPLALRIIGSSLYNKSKNEWISLLEKLKAIPDPNIMKILRISFDGLEPYLQNLFMDIACFWRGKRVDSAMRILEACGYFPEYGIKVLTQHALISIVHDEHIGDVFEMHDLVQEMGHHIVRGEHLNGPEKHTRVWEYEKIRHLCLWGEITSKEYYKTEAITLQPGQGGWDWGYDLPSNVCNIVSNMKSLRWLDVSGTKNLNEPTFLSNDLRCLSWIGYPGSSFPENFQPTKLVILSLNNSMQRELWKGCKHLPHLKELSLIRMHKLASTPDFNGLTCLQVLKLWDCPLLEEIPESIGKHTSLKSLSVVGCPIKKFPTTLQMDSLETLEMSDCDLEDEKMLSSIGELSNLQELDLSGNGFSRLGFNLLKHTQLKLLNLSGCGELLELPNLPSSLAILNANNCCSLVSFGDCYKSCKCLSQVTLGETGINKNDGSRILETMLEGVAVENGYMVLRLPGVEFAEGFRPPLLRGKECRLRLPKNWHTDFIGFLICIAVDDLKEDIHISMKQRADVVWKKRADEVWRKCDSRSTADTCAMYVSFDSLRETAWWDQTFKALVFTIDYFDCHGIGVRLVRRETTLTTAAAAASSSSIINNKYNPEVDIIHDDIGEGSLTIRFSHKSIG